MNRKTIPLVAAVMFINAQLANGQAYISRLASFNASTGQMPECSLIADATGNLYGTTNNPATVFELAAGSSTPATLVSLGYIGDPVTGLVADATGNLYGTTYSGGLDSDGTVFEVAAGTNSLTTLVNFGSNGSEGGGPTGLIIDGNGNLYGTTEYGTPGLDKGTVFEVAAGTHTLTTLATFNGANGENPSAGLVEDSSGNLYGTTFGGGNLSLNDGYGDGTVFEVAAGTHTLTTLATFDGSNGEAPKANLIEDANGDLYGTTFLGGDLSLNVGQGDGTVFEVAAGTHTLTTLATLNGANGDEPVGGLIEDASGNLYGTAYYGDNRGEDGNGTVFEVAAGSNALSVLFAFNGANGSNPSAGLIADAAGNLYGTTAQGGVNNDGTVFELSATGFVVPEPTSGLLLLIAGVGMFMRRSRTQSV